MIILSITILALPEGKEKMTKANINSKKGFTIIEVVLVLAIAGLIFLMVFVALPALQRNQRNTARKNNVQTIASALTSYAGDHNANLPTTVDQLKNKLEKKKRKTTGENRNQRTNFQTTGCLANAAPNQGVLP